MQKNHFLLLKKLKNTESAQLWKYAGFPILSNILAMQKIFRKTEKRRVHQYNIVAY